VMYDQEALKQFGMVPDPPTSTTNLVFKTDGSVDNVAAKWAGVLSQVGGRATHARSSLAASCCAPASPPPADVAP
jgi:hypothetical protein